MTHKDLQQNSKMFRVKDKRSLKPQLSFSSSVVVFYRTVGLLLLTQRSEGQFKVVGPPEPIATIAGDDIILPCHLNPAEEAVSMAVDWTRPDLTPRFVHVRRGGEDLLDGQNLMYEGRTSMFINKLKHGDTSLRLSNVKLSDAGKYRCFFPGRNIDTFVELVVGAVSSPVIVSINRASTGLVLQCQSKGWYPEPEVFWLDAEGNLLSAGPTETVRGPDDLYTVSRRLTVEKSDNFICRVQQKNINQTRETQIYIPDDFFSPPCSSAAHIITIISLAVVLMVVLGVVFVVWTRRRKQNSHNFTKATRGSNNTERPPLLVEEKSETLQVMSESIEDLDEKKTKLDEQLKKVQEGYKDVVGLLDLLNNNKIDVQQQKYDQQELIQKQKQDGKGLKKDYLGRSPDRKIQDLDIILKAVHYGETMVTEKKTELDNIMRKLINKLDEINDQQNTRNSSQTIQG